MKVTRYTLRAKRFDDVRAGYEARDEPHDPSIPGAAKGVARYAVVTESSSGHGYAVTYAETIADAETVGAANVSGDWWPVCVYDLDVLAGDEPLPVEVVHNGEEWMVHGHEWVNGERTGKWLLKKQPADRRRSTYDWATVDPAECELTDWEDPRMPVRYLLAKVVTVVAFNTRPEPA